MGVGGGREAGGAGLNGGEGGGICGQSAGETDRCLLSLAGTMSGKVIVLPCGRGIEGAGGGGGKRGREGKGRGGAGVERR